MIKKHEEILKKIVPWLAMVAVMYGMTLLKLPIIVTNLFFVVTTIFLVYRLWNEEKESKAELFLLMLGFGLRILVCLLDIYGSDLITVPFSGDDSMNFYTTSVEYYYGDTSRNYTYYPYIINAIYQVAGLNRFAAQYVNILCWCFCGLILQKSCKLLTIEGFLRTAAIGLLSVLPFHICLSSILMRDTIVALSIFWTTYHILKWMKNGETVNLLIPLLITLPVILVNNCVLAMLIVLGGVAAFYSPAKGKLSIEKKAIIIAAFGFGAIVAIALIEPLREKLFTQIPIFGGGIIQGINGRLKGFYEHAGGSTYLLNVYIENYWDLFVGTIQRIGYFLFSPVPWMWRGLGDIVAFLASSCVYLSALIIAGISFIYKKTDYFRLLLLSVMFFVSGIFAWGVSNGGTAMRHREKLLGVAILLAAYSIQLIINQRKNAKMVEDK